MAKKRQQKRQQKGPVRRRAKQETSREGKWDEEENLKFIKALQKYGDDCKLIREDIPGRSYIQVKNHWLRFMQKMKNHIKNPKKILSIIKSRPASDFVEPSFSSNFPLTTGRSKEDPGSKSSSSASPEEDCSESESSEEHSSSSEDGSQSEDKENSASESDSEESKEKGTHKTQRRKQPSRRILPEVNPSGMLDFISCSSKKRKKLEENEDEKGTEKEGKAQKKDVLQAIDEENKKKSSEEVKSSPADLNEIANNLSGSLTELMKFSNRLEANYLTHSSDILPDCVLAVYWSSLYGCSISLQHVVNDILLMNGSSSVGMAPLSPGTQYED